MIKAKSAMSPFGLSRVALVMVLFSFFALSSCQKSSDDRPELIYSLPENWQVAEDVERSERHRKIVLFAPNGDSAELELLSGELAAAVDSQDYMARFIDAAFIDDEARRNTVFDYGEVTRQGQNGFFIKVTPPDAAQVQFVMEFFQFTDGDHSLFVVFAISPNLSTEQQAQFDKLLGSIKLGG